MPNDSDPLLLNAARERVFASNRHPLRAPESPDCEVIYVKSGMLALYHMDSRGNRQIVGLRFPGELIVPGTRGRAGVWPLVKSDVLIANALEAEDSAVLEQQRRDAAIASEWLAQARAAASERLAHLLCEIATRGGYGTERMPNLLTQAQLADITGQTSVNVNRVMHDFEKTGLIERAKGEIIFKNWEGLLRLGSFRHDYYLELEEA